MSHVDDVAPCPTAEIENGSQTVFHKCVGKFQNLWPGFKKDPALSLKDLLPLAGFIVHGQVFPAAFALSKTFCAFFINGMSIIFPSRAKAPLPPF